jgi:hypothetical protein
VSLRHAVTVAAALALAFQAAAARGQGPEPFPGPAVVRPGAKRHDNVFFRIVLAKGLASMSADVGHVQTKITSQPLEYRAAAGYALTENIILFGELVSLDTNSSTATIRGIAPNRFDGHLSLTGFGAGATYYWMPLNLYVSAALAAVATTTDGTLGSTDRGPALDLAFGKEWWVSNTIGVGVSAQLLLARMSEKSTTVQGDKPAWTSTGASLGLSATFN